MGSALFPQCLPTSEITFGRLRQEAAPAAAVQGALAGPLLCRAYLDLQGLGPGWTLPCGDRGGVNFISTVPASTACGDGAFEVPEERVSLEMP